MNGMSLGAMGAWAATLVLGAALGAASAWGALDFGRARSAETFGPWSFNRAAGSVAAGPYSRAIIARGGLLALSAEEALYFTLARDEAGRALSESCVYELSGAPLPARWWSVTLYAGDNYLAQNNDHAGSVDASRVAVGAGGRWRVRVAPVRGEAANWLSSRTAGRGFSLMLRVYVPEAEFRPSADTLARIRTLSCAGGAP